MVFLLLLQTPQLLDLMEPRSMGVVYEHCVGAATDYHPETAAQQAQLSMLMELHCPFFRGEVEQ